MRRNIDPNRVVVGMMAKACAECRHVQHVFFKSQKEFDEWDCPVCNKRIEPDDGETKPEIES